MNGLESVNYARMNQAYQVVEKKISTSNTEIDKDGMKSGENDRCSQVLSEYGIDENEKSIDAVKTLEEFHMPLSKEMIEKLMISKDYFDTICEDLTYDMAVKLMEKGIDLEQVSIQKVADSIREVKLEEKTFSLLNLLSVKKKMTTDQAERMAKQIYGSRMGKDITNIIKSLHKEGLKITKKNIEKIHDVFYKLGKLENVEDETFVEVCKDDEKATIENLYNKKYNVTEGEVASDEEISDYASEIYEESVEYKDATEEDIRKILSDMGVEPTEENIEIVKEFMRRRMMITKENVNKVIKMKKDLYDLIQKLDFDEASKMMNIGIDIEKEDIRELLDILNNEKIEDVFDKNMDEKDVKKIQKKLIKIKDTDLIERLKKKEDVLLNEIKSVELSEKIDEKDLNLSEENKEVSEKVIVKGLNRIANISQIFQKVKNLSFSTIAFNMSNSTPLTLKTINENYDKSIEPVSLNKVQEQEVRNFVANNEVDLSMKDNSKRLEIGINIGKSLVQNTIKLSVTNIQKVFEAYGQYSRVHKNMTASMVMKSVYEGKDLENMELKKLDQYVAEKSIEEKAMIDQKGLGIDGIRKMMMNISKMGKEKEVILPLMIKNEMEFSLKEIENMSLFLKNQEQMGEKIGEVLQMTGVMDEPQFKKLKTLSKEVSDKLKIGDKNFNKTYEELIKHIEDMNDHEMDFSQDERGKRQEKQIEEMKKSLNTQRKLNRENICMQFPVTMGDKYKNLQIYVPQNLTSKDEPLRVLMNLDTSNLGKMNMVLKIDEKEASLSIGVKGNEEKNKLKESIEFLEDLLKSDGYILKEVVFTTTEKEHLLEGIESKSKDLDCGIFDIKI